MERQLIATGRKNGEHFEILPLGTPLSERARLEEALKRRLGSVEAMLGMMSLVNLYVNSERLLAQNELLVQLNKDLKRGRETESKTVGRA